MRRSISGIPNAAVLPVPVCALARTSLPARAGGIAAAWTGVGVVKPSSRTARRSAGLRPSASKVGCIDSFENERARSIVGNSKDRASETSPGGDTPFYHIPVSIEQTFVGRGSGKLSAPGLVEQLGPGGYAERREDRVDLTFDRVHAPAEAPGELRGVRAGPYGSRPLTLQRREGRGDRGLAGDRFVGHRGQRAVPVRVGMPESELTPAAFAGELGQGRRRQRRPKMERRCGEGLVCSVQAGDRGVASPQRLIDAALRVSCVGNRAGIAVEREGRIDVLRPDL